MKKALLVILALVMALTLVMGSVSTVSAKMKSLPPDLIVSIDINQVYGNTGSNITLYNSFLVYASFDGYKANNIRITITGQDTITYYDVTIKVSHGTTSFYGRLMGGTHVPIVQSYDTRLQVLGGGGKVIASVTNEQYVSAIN